MTTKNSAAFTLVEMLVVISIIAVIAALAFPAISGAVVKSQMTQAVSNGRQIYLATFSMANDGATTGDSRYQWPGDLKASSDANGKNHDRGGFRAATGRQRLFEIGRSQSFCDLRHNAVDRHLYRASGCDEQRFAQPGVRRNEEQRV